MSGPTADDLKRLTEWDTPTICNALELVMPERRGHGFTTAPFVALDPTLPPVCGYARTATIRAAAPPDEPEADTAARRVAYYEHVSAGDVPTVAVIQDLDPSPGVGAFWGEVQTNVHKGLGVLGGLTNGSIRDIDASAPGFTLLAGTVGPSHAFVHVVGVACEVTVHGMTVRPDNIVHADRHGAVIVPAEAVRKLPAAVDLISRREAVILEAARQPGFDFETLRAALAVSKEIH